ncbi:MAG: hypothetical protein MOB07_14955 [Acidobacteria bacterium]|nr:hypothetical protein [Acidobacteriota bacterium]
MSNDTKNDANSLSTFVGIGKDIVALLRDSALFILALLLLVFPSKFNTILVSAGFEEGSIVGFKWKSGLVQSDNALKEAQATITDLRAQLDKMSKTLAEAQPQLSDTSLKDNISKLQEENKQLNIATSMVEATVQSTIDSNAPLVGKIPSAANTRFGVVFSGDATLEQAKYEAETIAPKLGIPNASIFFREGMYRSVSVVDDRMTADQVLSKARRRRGDSYIVTMRTWCPRAEEKNGYQECISP